MTSNANADRSLIRFALHGGAGDLAEDGAAESQMMRDSRAALRRIAEEALAALQRGASALDAVTLAVERLEQCPLFNAGVGAVLNRAGQPELDAAIMRGEDRGCGAVAGIARVQSPVRLARAVMEQTPHAMFAGIGAEQLAQSLGMTMVKPSYFITPLRIQQLQQAQRSGSISLDHDNHHDDRDNHQRTDRNTAAKPDTQSENNSGGFGTVGAVARDAYGHLAAATSTGGLTNKLSGRIGDTPLIGVGTFADDNSCAISCTGTGEAFIKAGFANAIHARLAWNGWNLADACTEALAIVRKYGGRGGCIAIGNDGSVQLPFNSNAMYRAWCEADGRIHVAVRANDRY